MHFEISRGFKVGKLLTPVQRASGTFAEEPVVLGKVLRRGMRPLLLSEDQFKQHKAKLLRLLLSGSIDITVVDSSGRQPYKEAAKTAPLPVPVPVTVPVAGDATPKEEPEAKEPPSSPATETSKEDAG